MPGIVKDYASEVTAFVDLLYRQRIRSKLGRADFVPLKKDYLRNLFRNVGTWLPLIRDRVVECDGVYLMGRKSLGYRLAETYRNQTHRLVRLNAPVLLRRWRAVVAACGKQPDHRHLRDNLSRFTIDLDEFEAVFGGYKNADHYREVVRMIADGQYDWSVDEFAGRFHSAFTRLYKPLRSLLRADGEPVGEVDLPNSQPLFLGVTLKQRGVPCEDYLRTVSAGRFYDVLAASCGMSRDESKEEALKVFYAKNGYRSPLKTEISRRWPEVARFIKEAKAKDHTRLARLMQKAEAKFVLHTVVARIRHDRPDLPILTIHDSVLTRADDTAYVAEVVRAALGELGITPVLVPEVCDEAWRRRCLRSKAERVLGFLKEAYDG